MSSRIVKGSTLLLAVVGEVFLYLPLARAVRFLMGRPGDVGSVFPGFWLFVVIPGAVAFLASVATRLIAKGHRAPESRGEILNAAWLANVLLVTGSAVGYNLWWSE